LCSDEGQEETVTEVITLDKNTQRLEQLGWPWRRPNSSSAPCSDTCYSTKSRPFLTRIPPVQTVGPGSRWKPTRAARFAPCLAPVNLTARGWSIAPARDARHCPSDPVWPKN